MAASPEWKVYDPAGVYQAACKDIAAAACLVSFYGQESTIRWGHHRTVWTEGKDGIAAESYDATHDHIFDILNK